MKNILDDVITDYDIRILIRQAKIRAADGDNDALRIILAYKYGTPTAFHNTNQDKPSGGDSTGGGNAKQGGAAAVGKKNIPATKMTLEERQKLNAELLKKRKEDMDKAEKEKRRKREEEAKQARKEVAEAKRRKMLDDDYKKVFEEFSR